MFISKIVTKISRHFFRRSGKNVNLLDIPEEIILFKNEQGPIDGFSSNRIVQLLTWCFKQNHLPEFCVLFYSALAKTLIETDPISAFRLVVLLKYHGVEGVMPEVEEEKLKSNVLKGLKIGVAIVTYNRLERLKANVKSIQRFSKDIELIVADDGSSDGTLQWCIKENIACSNVKNSGVVANKNRALYYLHEVLECDVSILLEDDCSPCSQDWYQDWALSALVWGHINYAHKRILANASKLLSGNGSIVQPYRSKLVTGQCTATSLEALQKVGYLNPAFKGYGCGHVEWSERFLAFGFNGGADDQNLFACINTGLESHDAPSYKKAEDIARNRKLKAKISLKRSYTCPWGEEDNEGMFLREVSSFCVSPTSKADKVAMTKESSGNYLFVHLSKTAGTSFRHALDLEHVVWKDYGNKIKYTNDVVQSLYYDKAEPMLLKNEFLKFDGAWLVGHFSLSKYSDFVPTKNIVSFVRNPIEQVISHYNHFVRHHGYEGTIEEFLQRPSVQNFQSKNLNLLPIGLIGFIGITEKYEESLTLLNQLLGIQMSTLTMNVNRKKAHTSAQLSKSIIAKILELNAEDMNLYQQAVDIFEERLKYNDLGAEWVYGHFEINKQNQLVGCAYYSKSSEPVELQVFRNGKEFKTLIAKNFYRGYVKASFPRERYIGVNFPLNGLSSKEERFDLYVKSTGQKLNAKPLFTS